MIAFFILGFIYFAAKGIYFLYKGKYGEVAWALACLVILFFCFVHRDKPIEVESEDGQHVPVP